MAATALVSACSGSSTAVAPVLQSPNAAAPSPTPTVLASPSATASTSASPAPSATATASATASPVPTATSTLTANGVFTFNPPSPENLSPGGTTANGVSPNTPIQVSEGNYSGTFSVTACSAVAASGVGSGVATCIGNGSAATPYGCSDTTTQPVGMSTISTTSSVYLTGTNVTVLQAYYNNNGPPPNLTCTFVVTDLQGNSAPYAVQL